MHKAAIVSTSHLLVVKVPPSSLMTIRLHEIRRHCARCRSVMMRVSDGTAIAASQQRTM